MATLLLRLAAPIQSWGDESKYDIRQTCREPSKSGVIGLLAAAMGLRRDSVEISKLSSQLRMGVRVEMPGRVVRDFHTARPPKYTAKGEVRYEPDGTIMLENAPYVTTRYYLCDACFLVGLESENTEKLEEISCALESPCFPLYLGRRSCPLTLPLVLGIRPMALKESLAQEPWQAPEWYKRTHDYTRLRMIVEGTKDSESWHSLRDSPVSFNPIHRQYAPRSLEREQYVMIQNHTHDPMAELEQMP